MAEIDTQGNINTQSSDTGFVKFSQNKLLRQYVLQLYFKLFSVDVQALMINMQLLK